MTRTNQPGDQTRLRRLRLTLESAAIDLDVQTVGAAWTCPAGIEKVGEWLVWEPGVQGRRWRDPRPDFLTRFAELARLPEDRFQDAVLRYARHWGVLGLCQHGLPDTHAFNRGAPHFEEAADPCHRWKLSDGRCIEAIEPWRRVAAQADGMLRAAAAIDQGANVGQESWASFAELFPPGIWPRTPTPYTRRRGLTETEVRSTTGTIGPITVRVFPGDREAIAFAVRRWLDIADVRPVFTWSEHTSTGFGARTMFGALALRLATALASRTERPKLCRYGDHLYERRPRERPTTAFCDEREECRRKKWVENAQRRRAGEARLRGPYKRVAEDRPEADEE